MHKLNNKLNNFTSVTKILLVNKNKQKRINLQGWRYTRIKVLALHEINPMVP